MRTISLDLRERILASYDREEGTREETAQRFVSLWDGEEAFATTPANRSGPGHHRSGRKPRILSTHHRQMRPLLGQKPDLTLNELRAAVGLDCTLPAVHYALQKIGLTYKKRRSGPVSRTGRTSHGRAGSGGGARPASTRPS